jgi:hypothetical protein
VPHKHRARRRASLRSKERAPTLRPSVRAELEALAQNVGKTNRLEHGWQTSGYLASSQVESMCAGCSHHQPDRVDLRNRPATAAGHQGTRLRAAGIAMAFKTHQVGTAPGVPSIPPTSSRWSEPTRGSRTASSSNDPTNQQAVTLTPHDTLIDPQALTIPLGACGNSLIVICRCAVARRVVAP